MSDPEPTDAGATVDEPLEGFVVDGYEYADDVAVVVDTGETVVAFGYAPEIAERVEAGEIDHYVDVATDPPEEFMAALDEAGVEVHTNLSERAEGLYADGFSVAEGVGVIPCHPENTVVVRDERGREAFDVIISNAREGDPGLERESLSGTVPLYGTRDISDDGAKGGTQA